MEELDGDSWQQSIIDDLTKRNRALDTAADTRWDLLERMAEGWHAVIIPVINRDTAHDIIEWVQNNAKSAARLHMEGPEIESGNKGIGVFEDKADAALFKTVWAFND